MSTTSWLVGANVLRNLGLLAVLVLLARLTTPDDVGRYALALAITAPPFVFAQLGLKGIYLTLHGPQRFGAYLAVQGVATVVATAVSLLITALAAPGLTMSVAFVCAVKAADAFFELAAGALQKEERSATVFVTYSVAALLGVSVVLASLLATRQLEVALGGLAAANLLTAAATVAYVRARTSPDPMEGPGDPARSHLSRILRAGIPTGAAAAVLTLVSSMPQYFLAASRGEAEVGYFAVLLYLVAVADIFSGTLTQAWIPQARAESHRDPARRVFARYVLRTAARWTVIFVPLLVAGLAIAFVVLPVAFSPSYRITAEVAAPLAAAILMLPILHFGSTSIAVRNLYVHNITLSVGATALCLVACVILVPAFGVAGALWATAVGFLARAVAAILVLNVAGRREGVVPDRPPQVM